MISVIFPNGDTSEVILIKLIINADDFGYSPLVNTAIVKAFADGLVSSTTLMPNMLGFDDAVSLIKNGQIPADSTGIHLNLFEGEPLTKQMKECRVFCNEDGHFHGKRISFSAPCNCLEVVRLELETQLKKALDTGITFTHLDSHAHRHTNWYVGKVVIDLARKHGIPAVRQTTNLGKSNLPRTLLRLLYNLRLGSLRKTRYFGNIPDMDAAFSQISTMTDGAVEIMSHPVLNDGGQLVDAEFKQPLSELLSPFFDSNVFVKCSFYGL
jgi:predicted glycoside hydrolase/deacetylase ChbG (UPF0249 family)